ncbi:MAG: 5-(carboxyamino)imidazole ribonucleotide mutase [Chloroflexi bacterium]|jgi:5-(carboxyamino)imidazole ribonucleotide mutase|nr:5-(carboxyamino)imidazole ribonucleotide mutase [Chloroflexota bacterium]
MEACVDILNEMGIPNEIKVISAHRNPKKLMEYVTGLKDNGTEVVIAGAGGAAALPGAIASWTTLPVIGVPIASSELKGVDSLYSIVQMPPGIPVACVAIGSWGARNAAYFALQILGLKYSDFKEKYENYRSSLNK